jgi:uncharacterized membrane protein SirB2
MRMVARSIAEPDQMRILRPLVAALLLLGLAGLVLTMLLSFESPNRTLLYLSSALLMAPVLVVFAHVSLTRAMTARQRRLWFRHLTGRRAMWAFGDYLNSSDPGAAADRLAESSSRGRSE